jgi:hypothetical protein
LASSPRWLRDELKNPYKNGANDPYFPHHPSSSKNPCLHRFSHQIKLPLRTTRTRRHRPPILEVRGALEPPHVVSGAQRRGVTATSHQEAVRDGENHRVTSSRATALFSLKDPIEPCVVALVDEPAGVPMVPPWRVAVPPSSLLGRSYRFEVH